MTAKADPAKVISDIGRWGMVPEWLLDDPRVSAQAIRLFALLSAKYADRENERSIWPSRAKIAKQLFKTVATVDRAILELKAAGALETELRKTPEGDLTSSLYLLKLVPPRVRARVLTGEGTPAVTGEETVSSLVMTYPESPSIQNHLNPSRVRGTTPSSLRSEGAEAQFHEAARAEHAEGPEIPTRLPTPAQIKREQHRFGKTAEDVWLEVAARTGSMYTDRIALRLVHEHAIAALRYGTEAQVLAAIKQRAERETTPRRIGELTRLHVSDELQQLRAVEAREQLDEVIEPPMRRPGLRQIGGAAAALVARSA